MFTCFVLFLCLEVYIYQTTTKQATQSENNIQNINVREYRRGNQKDNPEKPATQGTQDEEKQSKNTTHVLATAIPKHTQIT